MKSNGNVRFMKLNGKCRIDSADDALHNTMHNWRQWNLRKCRVMGKRAFTLIELLVVIAIIALLLAILIPSLNLARGQVKKIVCQAHLKGLGVAILMYVDDYDGQTANVRNNGRWRDYGYGSGKTGKWLSASDNYAYWGIAYVKYASNRKVFHCPAAGRVDDWWHPEDLPLYKFCSFGLNGYTHNDYGESEHIKVTTFKRPTEVILAQDHVEQLLDDNAGGDMFYIPPGQTINLVQWRTGGLAVEYPEAVQECFRHHGISSTLWLDGHLSEIQETTGEDIPPTWYTGK